MKKAITDSDPIDHAAEKTATSQYPTSKAL